MSLIGECEKVYSECIINTRNSVVTEILRDKQTDGQKDRRTDINLLCIIDNTCKNHMSLIGECEKVYSECNINTRVAQGA